MKEWRNFASVYGKLRPPLRPSPGDVENIREAIAGSDRRVLLLGVTPELSVLGDELVAVDNSPGMLERAWPGDDGRRRALLADWTDLPFEDASFDAAIGDGSLNSAPGQVEQVLREVKRVLRPGGRAAFRVFSSPKEPEEVQSIHADVDAGRCGNLHALKWRIAMMLAARMEQATVPVRAILDTIDDMFPDRSVLATKTGWSIDEIATLDAYVGADHSLCFPTLPQLLDMGAPFFDNVRVIGNDGYPLAERCPTIVWSAH